ncbi:hypothetical protein RFN62_32330, partial [Rhodococcus erythropolis]
FSTRRTTARRLPPAPRHQRPFLIQLGGAYGLHKYCRVQSVTEPRIPVLTRELTWYPYTSRRTAIAEKVLRAAAGRGLRQRLGLNKEHSK